MNGTGGVDFDLTAYIAKRHGYSIEVFLWKITFGHPEMLDASHSLLYVLAVSAAHAIAIVEDLERGVYVTKEEKKEQEPIFSIECISGVILVDPRFVINRFAVDVVMPEAGYPSCA